MISQSLLYFTKKHITFIFLFVFVSLFAQQNRLISGNIIDVNNIPIAGVNILDESNSRNGAISDFDGNFSILVTPNSTLTFSYVGYETQVVKITTETILKIILQEDLSSLEEVTVVAYGKQKKSSVIAAVTSIDPIELKTSSSNLTTALAGRVAGVIAYQR